MATELSKINISAAASERIQDASGNPIELVRKLEKVIADSDYEFFSNIFRNSVLTDGSFEAGSWTHRIALRTDEFANDRAVGARVETADTQIRESVIFANTENNTSAEYFTAEHIAMLDASGLASDIVSTQLISIRNKLELANFAAMQEAAQAEFDGGRTTAIVSGVDTLEAPALFEALMAPVDALQNGDVSNKGKFRWDVSEIAMGVEYTTWRTLTTLFTNASTGSDIQAKMLLSNEIPANILGGVKIFAIPQAVMPTGVRGFIGTNGKWGTLATKRRVRAFIETPAMYAGEMYVYHTFRDAQKVVMPESITMILGETPVAAATTSKTK